MGFKLENRCLNNVEFSAMLQQDGLRLMIDHSQSRKIHNLTIASILIAATSALTSIGAVLIQANDSTDKQLMMLNQQLQHQVQSLESMQQSQKGIDASLSHIKDSLRKKP